MTVNRKKILFVNDEMRMGGVARVLNTLMEALPEDQYEIDLLVLHKRGMLLKEVPANVHILEGSAFFQTVDQSLPALLQSFDIPAVVSKIRLLLYMKTGLIKKKIKEERSRMNLGTYDIEVAAKEGFCTIFTACGTSRKKINWVLTDYSVCNYSKRHMNLVKWALQYIDLNVADSTQALKAYEDVFHVTGGVAIHNLMDMKRIDDALKEPSPIHEEDGLLKVICVARFHPQKAIDRLLIASKEADAAGLKHHLYLVGGGEEEKTLKQYALDNHMDYVTFCGYMQNPYSAIEACDLFVLTSLYEGFATVINESLIASTPVLTAAVSGTEEQITSDHYGWIVENSQKGINEGLQKALKDPSALAEMKQQLKNYHYPNDRILKQFLDILQ